MITGDGILIKNLFLKLFFVKNWLVNHFFPSTNLQPYTFWEKFSHAHVNEFDDWGAPSHCKTFGLIFRKWICMGRPKWLINSGLDCIFLQVGLRKKNVVMDGFWDWDFFSFCKHESENCKTQNLMANSRFNCIENMNAERPKSLFVSSRFFLA